MKKFKFRLAALLKMKEHMERECQKEHGSALRKVVQQKNELTRLDGCRISEMDRQRGRLTGRLSVAEMLVYSRYLVKLKQDRVTGQEMLAVLEKDAEKKRVKLVEASREKKTYEKLKERWKEQHDLANRRAEAKEDDETAITSFRRKMT